VKHRIFGRPRLLHAVVTIGIALLGLKCVGLFHDARAQESNPKPSAAVEAVPRQASAPAANVPVADDDAENVSASEMDVLTSLSKRRAELDAREDDLVTRENLLKVAEQRVDAKIAELKSLQTQIQQLLGQRDAAAQKQLDSLVKTYSAMKPKDAARIFNTLDENVRLAVAQAMKPDVLAAILAQMQPDAAQSITVKLAERFSPASSAAVPPVQNQQASAPAPLQPVPIAAQQPAPTAAPQTAPIAENGAESNASPPAKPAPAQAVSAGTNPHQ